MSLISTTARLVYAMFTQHDIGAYVFVGPTCLPCGLKRPTTPERVVKSLQAGKSAIDVTISSTRDFGYDLNVEYIRVSVFQTMHVQARLLPGVCLHAIHYAPSISRVAQRYIYLCRLT